MLLKYQFVFLLFQETTKREDNIGNVEVSVEF